MRLERDSTFLRSAAAIAILVAIPTIAVPARCATILISKLTTASNPYGDMNPVWAPDGSRIAFESRDANPAYPTIYAAQLPGGSEAQLTGAGELAPDYEMPSYSPDGTKLVYAKKDGEWYHLYVRPAAGGAETALTSGTAGPSGAYANYGDLAPTWSPDGQWAAFASSRADLSYGFFDIWVVKANGQTLTQATHGGVTDTGWPTWSADGSHLLYSQNNEIWQVARTGPSSFGSPSLLWNNGNHPSFAPGGTRVAYESAGDIYVRAYPGGSPIPITSGADEDMGPSWSPDGGTLAFSSNRGDGNRAIWLASGVGKVPTIVLTLGKVKATYR